MSDRTPKTYFIQPANGGAVKIGFTTGEADSRLGGIQTGNPEKLVLVGFIDGDKEKDLHEKFKHHRLSGEWFKLGDDLASYLRELGFKPGPAISTAASGIPRRSLPYDPGDWRYDLEPLLDKNTTWEWREPDEFETTFLGQGVLNYEDHETDNDNCECDGCILASVVMDIMVRDDFLGWVFDGASVVVVHKSDPFGKLRREFIDILVNAFDSFDIEGYTLQGVSYSPTNGFNSDQIIDRYYDEMRLAQMGWR